MKKIIILVLATLLLVSCSDKSNNVVDDVSDKTSEVIEGDGKEYTLYLGILQDHDASEGKAKFSSTYAAVVCDSKGKIVDCEFDATDDTVIIDGGTVETGGNYPSKREQGDNYGMKKASSIGEEWYEQADDFADSLEGKTLTEAVKADTTAGCTIDISGFLGALEAAKNDTQAVTFKSTDEPDASVAVVNSDNGSKNASDEADGVAAMTSTYAAVAGDNGRILASAIDVTETKVYFDTAGLVSSISEGKGKREMGDSYGMKGASSIGMEWYEQAQYFENYVKGMDASAVSAIKTENGYAASADLSAGCTININDFIIAVSKAAKG